MDSTNYHCFLMDACPRCAVLCRQTSCNEPIPRPGFVSKYLMVSYFDKLIMNRNRLLIIPLYVQFVKEVKLTWIFAAVFLTVSSFVGNFISSPLIRNFKET
jgi:hypothetical protein